MHKKSIVFIISAICLLLFSVSCTDKQDQESIPLNSLPALNSEKNEQKDSASFVDSENTFSTESDAPMTSNAIESGQNSIETNKPGHIDTPEDIMDTENDSAEDLPIEETEEVIESEFVIDIGDNAGVGGN